MAYFILATLSTILRVGSICVTVTKVVVNYDYLNKLMNQGLDKLETAYPVVEQSSIRVNINRKYKI